MNRRMLTVLTLLSGLVGFLILQAGTVSSQLPGTAKDPGVRTGTPGAGAPLSGLTQSQTAFFTAGLEEFQEEEETTDGLGPMMNLDSCSGCHSQPAIGGSSPAINPQLAFATKNGATNSVPSFITFDGPVREARFVKNADGIPDGGVHALYTIAGRADASGCSLAQPDFATAVANNNVIFRIPTPVFGAGLIEQIPDNAILANRATNTAEKTALGIGGRPNIVLAGSTISGQPNKNGNDGTLARFGWKAQNKSLLLFSGEAYNVEMGVTNELFQTERNETEGCQYSRSPNDVTNMDAATSPDTISGIEKFAVFMRFLAPPEPSPNKPGGAESIGKGRRVFNAVGCALCHTPTLHTGNSSVAAMRNKPVHLFSDLLLHDMGSALADGVTQGQAGPREFRTAPLWGLGQRIFFLHDGRTKDLVEAIEAHFSPGTGNRDGSEANAVIRMFRALPDGQKQDLLNFLRSL